MSNPTQNISGINNSFDAFQPPLSPEEDISELINAMNAFQGLSSQQEDISLIMKAFNAFQTPLLMDAKISKIIKPLFTDENSSSDPIERLTKRIVARETQSCMREWEEATRSDRIYDLENLSKELSDVSKELSALSPSADSSPAIAKLQGRVLDVLSTCNEMQKALQNAVTNKIEATANRNADLMAFTAGLYGRKDRIRAQLNKISYGK